MRILAAVTAVVVMGLCAPPATAAPDKKAKKQKKIKKQKKDKRQYWKRYVHFQKRAYLGVHLLPMTRELRAHFGAPEDAGVMVSRVEEGSPAQAAGVQVGDLLLEVEGEKVASAWQVARKVRSKKQGERLSLRVMRRGGTRTLSVALKLREKPTMEVSRFIFRYPGGEVRFPEGWDDKAFQQRMERFKERYKDLARPEGLWQLKDKERRMEQRLKKLEEKIRKLEKRLQGKRTAL